jgi:hypothetical protein
MSQTRPSSAEHHEPARTSFGFGRKTFVAWTVFSALAVWLGLSVAEGLAKDRCNADGLAWNWKQWDCAKPSGIIILPPGLRRAGSD